MSRLYLGIDNGSSGAIAVLRGDGSIWRVDPMPATDVDVLALLQTCAPSVNLPAFAYLEHAQAFPKMGVSSAFNYGKGYGAVQMALAAIGIGFDIITPRKWQAGVGCLSGGDKNVTKRRAQQLFPGAKVTHAIADALLIAEYCRRIRGASDGKEEGRRAQPVSEARPATSVDALERFVQKGRNAQRAVDEAIEGARPGRAAESDAPRHGAGTQQAAGQHLRGHRGRARNHEQREG